VKVPLPVLAPPALGDTVPIVVALPTAVVAEVPRSRNATAGHVVQAAVDPETLGLVRFTTAWKLADVAVAGT
jgi:hypothetical protein